MKNLQEVSAWVNDIVANALETEKTNKKSDDKKK